MVSCRTNRTSRKTYVGHAGAIVGGADDTAAAKMKIMGECGVTCGSQPCRDIGKTMAEAIGRNKKDIKVE